MYCSTTLAKLGQGMHIKALCICFSFYFTTMPAFSISYDTKAQQLSYISGVTHGYRKIFCGIDINRLPHLFPLLFWLVLSAIDIIMWIPTLRELFS